MAEEIDEFEAAELEAPTLKELIKERLGSTRKVLPPTPDKWFRVSQIASLCAREEVLAAKTNFTRDDKVSADLATIFAHGHGLHYSFQNIVLPDVGVLLGKWVCVGCGKVYGKEEEGKPVTESAVLRPDTCEPCGGEEFLFVEYDLKNDEHRLTGHSDGFLSLEGLPGLGVFEGKSINPKGAWEVRSCPKLDHVIQIQCYMWMTGLQWGKIFYWDKAGFGTSAFVEHTIERDEELIDGVKHLIKTIRLGISSGELPARICEETSCPRAKECQLSKVCFKED